MSDGITDTYRYERIARDSWSVYYDGIKYFATPNEDTKRKLKETLDKSSMSSGYWGESNGGLVEQVRALLELPVDRSTKLAFANLWREPESTQAMYDMGVAM